MKYLFTCLALVLGFHLSAQNFIDKHFSDLEDLEESKVIHVAARSFDIAAQIVSEDEDAAEMKEFIGSIHSVDVVVVPEYAPKKEDYKRALGLLDGQYDELMNFKESGSRFSLHIDEDDDVVREVVAVGYGDDDEFVLISVTGEMSIDMISKVIENVPVDDIAAVRELKSADSKEFNVYPNPVAYGAELSIDVPNGFSESEAVIHDMTGNQVGSYKVYDGKVRVNTSEIGSGAYYVIIKDGGLSLKKKFIVLK